MHLVPQMRPPSAQAAALMMGAMVVVVLTADTAWVAATPIAWTGDMHPKLGFGSNPQCDAKGTRRNCAPTYEALEKAGALWKCPTGTKADNPGACGAASPDSGGADTCEPGSGGNPLCMDLGPDKPCCCPSEHCYAEPQFNQIIGVCQGAGCACGANATTAPSCGNGKCDGKCSGASVPCCFGNDVSELMPYYEAGSQVTLNYMAAYTFDNNVTPPVWRALPESSFNTDAKYGAYDLMQPSGGLDEADAWLAPQPGGSVYWSLGYYAAGVRGAGPPGAMFVLSSEQFWGATWYVLNQLTMDRGPGSLMPADMCADGVNDNCWAAGNAGEMDFLEPSWSHGNASSTTDYRQSYSTQWNQIGRCFNGGVNGGGFGSHNYVLTSPMAGGEDATEAIIYVAIMDSVGNWLYRIPADMASQLWPGLTRTTANETLQAAPTQAPPQMNPCLQDYCAVFTSNCQATTWADADAQQCGFNRQQGFCGNWASQMANTGQPLWPSQDCERDTRGGKTMPWCKQMVA